LKAKVSSLNVQISLLRGVIKKGEVLGNRRHLGKRLLARIKLSVFFLNESLFLLRSRTGHIHDHIEHPRQEEADEEKAQKEFGLSDHEEEESKCEDDQESRMIVGKPNNAVRQFE